MSIHRWLATSKPSTATSTSVLSFLPHGDATTYAANRKVFEALD